MKILFHSYAFAPSVGGIETVSEILAREFVSAGHEVKLVTAEGKEDGLERPYQVLRGIGPVALWKLSRWCDLIFQNNISLQLIWPNLASSKPVVIAVQTWLNSPDGWTDLRKSLKLSVLRRSKAVSISRSVANSLPFHSTILGNPYRDDVFKLLPEISREKELVFVGRLVSDKGLDLLLEALALLDAEGLRPGLTVVGDGPDRENLESLSGRHGLASRVRFVGTRKGVELARLLNAHRIMIVPSRWAEPFGVVALEGIACGCAVVGSEEGGLKEAIGPCGITFANGDADDLVRALKKILETGSGIVPFLEKREEHLSGFRGRAVAESYLKLFQQVLS
ncbi:MAG: glycosyltransferase family 4 protein [Proteobacteria bacterium]|nr:glycosyltransferase family 4 protein [Pseudomonadota bacterium]